MPGGQTFKAVEAIGRTLPDVEVTTTWGKPTLKVCGKVRQHQDSKESGRHAIAAIATVVWRLR